MGFLSGLLGGGEQSQTQTQTSSTAPWAPQQPYLKKGLSRASKLSSRGFNPLEKRSQSEIIRTTGQLQPTINNAQGFFDFAFGPGRDPTSNPYLQSAIDLAIDPVQRRLEEQILPSLRSEAIGAGGFGGSRQRYAGELPALRQFGEQAGDIAAGISYGDYAAGQDRALSAAGLLPTLTSTALSLPATRAGIGEQRRMLPWENLARMWSIVGTPLGQEGTATGTTTQESEGSFLNAALGIAGLAGGLGWSPFAAAPASGLSLGGSSFGIGGAGLGSGVTGAGGFNWL